MLVAWAVVYSSIQLGLILIPILLCNILFAGLAAAMTPNRLQLKGVKYQYVKKTGQWIFDGEFVYILNSLLVIFQNGEELGLVKLNRKSSHMLFFIL